MYESIHIQNFKGFQDLTLNNLGRINLIGGKNNVGKTSLLEAVMLSSRYFDTDFFLSFLPEYQDWYSLIFNHNAQADIVISTTQFDGHNDNISIKVEPFSNDSNMYSELEDRYIYRNLQKLVIHESEMVTVSYQDNFISFYKTIEGVQVWFSNSIQLNQNSFGAIYSTELVKKGKLLGALTDKFDEIKFNKSIYDLLLTTLQYVEPRLRRLDSKYNDKINLSIINGVLEGLEYPIPIISMGQGINRLLEWLIGIGSMTNGILCIDEIENGLHYSAMPKILGALHNFAEQQNIQIFATTHSEEMIHTAYKTFEADGNQDVIRFYRLDQDDETLMIDAKLYTPDILQTAIEADFEIRG